MKFSGRTTSHSHKFNDWQTKKVDGKPCVRTIKLIDVQWSDCPVEIEDVVRKMWRACELGNDHYHLSFNSLDDLDDMIEDETDLKVFKEYLKSQGVQDKEQCFIYWWW